VASPPLDEFLRTRARKHREQNISSTFVAVPRGGSRVVGYNTLAKRLIEFDDMPAALVKRLPRHPVPAILLGRFAVDMSQQGRGLGSLLLVDALRTSVAIADLLGVFAVILDAKNDTVPHRAPWSERLRCLRMARMPSQRGDRDDRALVVAEKIARVMDGMYLDPLLGFFIPWAGDVVGAGLGLYPVWLAWKRGAPKTLLARMLLNLSVDLLAGAVPFVGDIGDFFFKAHRRNLHLLRARWDGGAVRARAGDRLVVAGALLVFLLALATPIVLLVLAVRAVGW
jgi:hypothetical protein